jgi:hypothetical protein
MNGFCYIYGDAFCYSNTHHETTKSCAMATPRDVCRTTHSSPVSSHAAQHLHLDFCLVPAHHADYHMGRLLLSDEVCWKHICQPLGLITRSLLIEGHARWSEATCIGSGSRMDCIRRLITCVASLQLRVRGVGANYDRNIRQVYGVKALQENSGFPSAQCKFS